MNSAVAIIPARGGSKRIPRKNIREFHGKPIIAYSIEAARKSRCFDRIVVSTDDNEIADVARHYGAEVPFIRPAALADDHTGTSEVTKHALQELSSQGATFELACCIYATAPFLTPASLREGLAKLKASGRSFAFSVTSCGFPIQRALRILPDGSIDPIWPENIMVRSQDLEPTYHDAGQFYWGVAKAFLQDRVLYSEEAVAVILPRYLVHDIDTLEDWTTAELAFSALQSRQRSCA